MAWQGCWETDSLDVRILRLLLQGQALSVLNPDFREPIATIAKKVGEHEDTVRNRLKKIEETGFFADWRLTVNPCLLGGGQVCVWFDLDPVVSKQGLVDGLHLVPGVIFVHAFYDGAVVFLQYEDERVVPREVELIHRLCGASNVMVARTVFPKCKAVLKARDWDLIRALRKNPRKSCGDLAAEVGLSCRTVRIRLSRLIVQGVAFAWPSLNLRAPHGGLLIHLVAWYPTERKAEIDESIMTHFEPIIWHVLHMLPYRDGELCPCGYNMMVPNMCVAREVLEWVRTIPGVEKTRLYLHEQIYNFFDVYDEELERKLRGLPTALPETRAEVKGKPLMALKRS